MNPIDLKQYRIRQLDSYFNRGYYLADIISFHRTFAGFNNCSDELEFNRNGCLGVVKSFIEDNKEDDIICYDPIELYHTRPDNLLYVAAHEAAHIKNNDGMRIRFMNRLLGCLGVSLTLLLVYVCLPLIVTVPILIEFIRLGGMRQMEMQADLESLNYVGPEVVVRFAENFSGLRWLYHDHTTREKATQMVIKKEVKTNDV